jgi:hypothetical protein
MLKSDYTICVCKIENHLLPFYYYLKGVFRSAVIIIFKNIFYLEMN